MQRLVPAIGPASHRMCPYGPDTLSEAVLILFPLLARIVALPTLLAVTAPLLVEFPIMATDLGVTSHFTWRVTSRTDPPEK